MSFDHERPERHPLCTCPELTWGMVTGCADAPDLAACRARAPFGINPHPVITFDDVLAMCKQLTPASRPSMDLDQVTTSYPQAVDKSCGASCDTPAP